MNAERLLAHYERIAEAPDAISRLRHFVRDLAVRGKLVPQDPNDEPASELLKQIAAEKARLVKAGDIKRFAVAGNVDNEIQPFDLPSGWLWVTLGGVLTKLTDGTHHSPPNEPVGDFMYITAKNIKDEGVSLTHVTYVSQKVHDDIYSRCNPEKGDILYIKDGATTGVVTINDLDDPFSMLSSVALLKLPSCLFNRLVVEFLRSPFFYDQMRGFMKGAAITRVTLKRMAPALVPLPPLAEQYRIVTKVDELMALCDRLESARTAREATRDRLTAATLAGLNAPDPETFLDDARLAVKALPALIARPDQTKQLRQTILNLAVRGKLVPQNPNDEPASEVLKRIAKEKARLVKGRESRELITITPIDSEDAPYPVAPSWVWASFGDIVISRDGERIPVSKEERNNRAKTFDYYGASGVIDKIDDYLFDKPLLLIGEDGANLINRSTPIAFIARGKYWVNNHAHVLDGLSEEFLRYIELFINAIDLKPYVTGTAQPKMNQAKMNSIPVAVPPLAEQHRIVAKVGELIALCDRLEASLTQASATRCRLLEALLAEALAPDAVRELEAAE
jgi:type I restriction enzyme, S subunit